MKNKIKTYLDRQLGKIKNQERKNSQIIFDYQALSDLFQQEIFIPHTNWSISPTAIRHIINDIFINNRKFIIEFGSGASTIYISKALKILSVDCKFISIDSSENWVQKMNHQLNTYGLNNYCEIKYVPLSKISEKISYKNQEIWYNSNILHDYLKEEKDIDLVICDGPHGKSTPFARYSAIPFLVHRLTDNCSIFLDDTNRMEEKEIAKEWSKLLNINVKHFYGYSMLYHISEFDCEPFQLVSELP